METTPHPGSDALFPPLPATPEGLRDTAIAALHGLAERYPEGAWEFRFMAVNLMGAYRRIEAERVAAERRAKRREA